MNIIVKELPRTMTEKQLLALFLPFGEVRAHNLVKEPGTGKSKGFGFVEMPDNLQARDAIKALHNKLVEDVRIRVKMISRKYEPLHKKPAKAKPEYTGPRTFGAITRSEELGTERPERSRGRGIATSQRSEGSYRPRYEKTESRETDRPMRGSGAATPQRTSESRGSTGSGWTRSRSEAEGSNRTSRYSDRATTQPARSEGNFRPRYEKAEAQGTAKPKRGRGPATPKRPGSKGSSGSGWTKSRAEAEGSNRRSGYSDRTTAQPARIEGSSRPRYDKTESRGPDRPFRGERAGTYSDRGAARPASTEGNYRVRPAKAGAKKAVKPAKGLRTAKRGRTPARPVKTGRSGARQSKAPHKSKQR